MLVRNFQGLRAFRSLTCLFRSLYSSKKMPSALVLLSEGAEEMEAIISIDVMRRGELAVTVGGVEGASPVVCSRNVRVVPDKALADAVKEGPYDVVVLPGGLKGAQNLAASDAVGKILKDQESNGRIVAAICAAPIALASHGIAKGKTLTSHPSVKDKLTEAGYTYSEERVMVDGKLVTSRGPGTAFEFALKLVELLQGAEKAKSLVPPMLLKL